MTPVFLYSNKWNTLQQIMNDRKTCIDNVPLVDAIVFDARIHHKATPIYENDYGQYYTSIEALISAMQNYIDITEEEVRNA